MDSDQHLNPLKIAVIGDYFVPEVTLGKCLLGLWLWLDRKMTKETTQFGLKTKKL